MFICLQDGRGKQQVPLAPHLRFQQVCTDAKKHVTAVLEEFEEQGVAVPHVELFTKVSARELLGRQGWPWSTRNHLVTNKGQRTTWCADVASRWSLEKSQRVEDPIAEPRPA